MAKLAKKQADPKTATSSGPIVQPKAANGSKETPDGGVSGVSQGVDGGNARPLRSDGQRRLLEDGRSVRVLARLLGMSPSTVGHWRTGERTPDRDQRLKLEGHLGIPSAAWDVAPYTSRSGAGGESPRGSGDDEGAGLIRLVETLRERREEVAGGDQRDWVDWARAELIVLQDEGETCAARIGDLDRLLSSALYGQVRAAVLAALAERPEWDLVEPAFPRQPETLPSSEALETHRAAVASLEAAAYREMSDVVGIGRPRDVIGLTKVQLDCRRIHEKLGILSTPGELVTSGPWEAVMLACSRALVRAVDARAAVVEALARLPENALAVAFGEVLQKVRHIQFPSADYRQDPARFCREVLGFVPWSKQVEILEAIRDQKYVAIKSGQKTGKSRILAAAALWWFCAWPDGKVLFSNSTGKQLENINWSEVATLHQRSGACVECREDPTIPRPCPHSQKVDGTCLKSSRGGLKSEDLERSVLGIQAKDAEGIQGFSGAHLLILVDEASSLSAALYQAFFGNTAARGAKMVMVSNPTKLSGPFFDAFHRGAKRWHCITISSLEAAAEGVAGLASPEYCQAVLEEDERGEKSPFYQVRVLGNFPANDTTAIYPVGLIVESETAWESIMPRADVAASTADLEGRLVIAIDPAGESGFGDDGVFTVGRGEVAFEQRVVVGGNTEEYVRVLRELASKWGRRGEAPLVAIDADGVGHSIHRRLVDLAEETHCWDVRAVYFGHQARDWRRYDTTGEELHAALADWFAAGGAIPRSTKLEQELERMQWIIVRRKRNGREIEVMSSTRKSDLRKELHRSPDRLDSLRIFGWAVRYQAGLATVAQMEASEARPKPAARDAFEAAEETVATMDPYAGVDAWSR